VTSLDGALAVCRLAHYAALVFVFGTAVFVRGLAAPGLAAPIGFALRVPVRLGLLLAAATTWLWLPLEAGEIGGGWGGATDPGTLSAVLFDTGFGQAWLCRAVLSVALLILAAAWPRRMGAVALAAGLLLASLSLTGHAAMQDGTAGLLHRLNHAVHLLTGGFWLGALVPFVLCLPMLRDPALRCDVVQALRRFSTAGHVAVAAVLASGVGNVVLVLGRWPTDWSSPYQALLAAKIAAVLAMAGLAVANRYVFVPRIGRSNGAAVLAIRNGAVAEILLGVAVLALVAVFGLLDPA
jgi:putative copper resistance protein D